MPDGHNNVSDHTSAVLACNSLWGKFKYRAIIQYPKCVTSDWK